MSLNALRIACRNPGNLQWHKLLKPRIWADFYGMRRKYPNAWHWILTSRRIEGWLSDGEANELFYLARQFAPQEGATVLELGSWKGKSSVMLGAALREKIGARLFCIDPFGDDENPEHQQRYYAPLLSHDRRSVEELFRSNVAACGLQDIVHPLKGYSFDFASGWRDLLDVLFIDANHEYEAVARDFHDFSGFVKPGGVIAFHDANGRWPGPTRVVSECLQPPVFGPVHTVDSLAWAQKLLPVEKL